MKKHFFSILILTTLSTFNAQQKEEDIEEIELQGKFLSLPLRSLNENAEIITRAQIEASAAQTLDDVLQQTLGVDLQRRGASGMQSDVAIRGGSFEQTLVLINGIRMNDAQTGHNSFHVPVDLKFVERIEVLKGPAARRYGNNAFAGVINIVTSPKAISELQLNLEGGDYSSYQIGAGAQLAGEKMNHLIQLGTRGSEGYRHNTDFTGRNAFYQGSLPLNKGQISLQAGFSERKFGANGFYATPLATEQYEETQASVLSLNWNQTLGKVELKSNVFWRRGQDLYLYDREDPDFYRNMHIGNNYGIEISAGARSSLGYSGLGVELREEDLSSNNLGNRNRFLTQVFFEHHFSFLEGKLQIVPGMTWAGYSEVGNFFYPGLDLGYHFSPSSKLYANVSKVHRIPTFTDLYYVSRTEKGNPLLKPENAFSYELGYSYSKNRLRFGASVFGREIKNGIDWVKEKEEDLWQAMNIGELSTRGFETSVSYRGTSWLEETSLGYTFIDQEIGSSENFSKYVLDHLRHQLVGKVYSRITREWSLGASYRYQARANNYSYHLVDLKTAYDFDRLNVYLRVNNLTNTQYKEAFGVPMPGRVFHIGLNYKLPLSQ